jgi:hypothetical protein
MLVLPVPVQVTVHYACERQADGQTIAEQYLGIRDSKKHMKTSGKLFITTLHGDQREKVPYLKKNAKHGLWKETV